MSIDKTLWPLVVATSWLNRLTEDSKTKLSNAPSYLAVLGRVNKKSEFMKAIQIAKHLEVLNIKHAEKIFENSLSDAVKKAQGAVYTPDYIIENILETCCNEIGISSNEIPTVLDPACGSGGFLVGAVRYLSEKLGISYSEASSKVLGIDINAEAVENGRLLLDMLCLERDGALSEAKLIQMDSLLTPVSEQLNALGVPSGVDVLATNPPFVKIQNLPLVYRKLLTTNFELITSGSFTLASIFLSNAPEYLNSRGIAGFITPNNVFTSLSAVNLRKEWQDKKNLLRVLDFRHFPVFNASAYTCLIFLDKGAKSRKTFLHFAMNEEPTLENIRAVTFHKVPYSGLKSSKWRLGSPNAIDLVMKLENCGVRLGQVVDIKAGVATLLDRAFICEIREDAYTAVGGDGLTRTIEPVLVKKFTKISELRTGATVSDSQKGIIYTFDESDDTLPVISELELQTIAPNTYAHLKSWQENLLKRSGSDRREWYAWGRRQSLTSKGPKLFTKTFDAKPTFYLDKTDGLFANGYSLTVRDSNEGYSISQIKAFLESRFMFAYALVTSFEIQGAYQCYQKNFIENVCLPPQSLLPDHINAAIAPGSEQELKIARFFGIEVDQLESCLSSYTSP